jgi:ATP synthase protein I
LAADTYTDSVTSAKSGVTDTSPEITHEGVVRQLADEMFRGALWLTVATVVVGMIVSAVLAGLSGLLGALVGGGVACASSLATLLVMRKTAALDVHFVMAAALGGFVGKMFVLLIVMILLRDVPMFDQKALALTMLATVVIAAAAEARASKKSRFPMTIPVAENA